MPAIPSVRSRIPCDGRSRAGFTLFEAIIVLVIVATVVGALTPSVQRVITNARVNRAANVIAADLLQAQSLAARNHTPVRVQIDASAFRITLTIANAGTQLMVRELGPLSDFKLPGMTTSTSSVLVLPTGMVNTSVTITISSTTVTRTITMSRAGQVRIS